jgi:hypothetical protein
MRRRMFNILAGLSFALCLLSAAAWIASYWSWGELGRESRDWNNHQHQWTSSDYFGASAGRFYYVRCRETTADTTFEDWPFRNTVVGYIRHPRSRWLDVYLDDSPDKLPEFMRIRDFTAAGLRVRTFIENDPPLARRISKATFPCWSVVMAAAILPLTWTILALRQGRLVRRAAVKPVLPRLRKALLFLVSMVCLLSCFLWIASYWDWGEFSHATATVGPGIEEHSNKYVGVARGVFYWLSDFGSITSPVPKPTPYDRERVRVRHAAEVVYSRPRWAVTHLTQNHGRAFPPDSGSENWSTQFRKYDGWSGRLGGFAIGYGAGTDIPRANDPRHSRSRMAWLMFPAWALVAVTGSWPTIALIFRVRRRRRLKLGLCLRCGYDLRASGDLCPECGEPRHTPSANLSPALATPDPPTIE